MHNSRRIYVYAFLQSKRKKLIVNNRGWRRIYRPAIMFGWKPLGTQPPESWENPQEWDPMNYFFNDGQMASALDANLLADLIYEVINYLEENESDTRIKKFIGKIRKMKWFAVGKQPPFMN